VAIPAEGGFGAIPFEESSVVSSMIDLTPVPEESPEKITEAGEPLRGDAVLPDGSVDIAHRTFYSQGEGDVVAPHPHSHTEPPAPTASIHPVPAESSRSISVAWPVMDASAMDCSEDVHREIQEARVPDRPRRKHRRRTHRGHRSCHPVQHDPRASGRSNDGEGSTIDRAVTKQRGNKPTTTPEQRKSQSSRPRLVHNRGREPRSSLKQRLIRIIKEVLAAFRGLERQKPRRREKFILRGKRIA